MEPLPPRAWDRSATSALSLSSVGRPRETVARAVFGGCIVALLALISGCATRSVPDPREDSPEMRAMVDSITAALADPMKRRTPEEALLVDIETLYEPLDEEQRACMEALRSLPGAQPVQPDHTDGDGRLARVWRTAKNSWEAGRGTVFRSDTWSVSER